MRVAIERASATLLYLPPYKPDFNPIETAFAKLKVLLRTAAARTIAELWDARRDTLPKFSPAEWPTTSPPQEISQIQRILL